MTDQTSPGAALPGWPPAAAGPLEARLRRMRRLTAAAIVVSLLSLAAAVTAPLWQAQLYGQPYAARLMVLAAAQLRPVLNSDQPFAIELSALRTIDLGDDNLGRDLRAIADYADRGVPTVAQLNARFVRVANEITVGTGGLDPNPTWIEKAAAALSSGIQLNWLAHSLADPRENTAIVWDARVHVEAGDLAGAVAVLDRLTDRPAVLARSWVAEAKARLAVDRVQAQLDALATEVSRRNPLRLTRLD